MPQKFIQQRHKLPTLPKFMTHQHCSSYIMPKKYNNSKNVPKPRLKCDQPCNAPNFNKSTRQQNDNVSTSNSQFQMSNFQSQVLSFRFQILKSQIFKLQISSSKFQTSKIKSFSKNYKNQSKFSS